MKVYKLEKKQQVNANIDQVWSYFSSPINLKTITPDYMGFDILSDLGDGKMYAGQIIHYIVTPVLGLPMRWTTEITHVEEGKYFVDEQRFGPYALWHHQHWFYPNHKGVLMKDIVNYAIPFGPLGRLANTIMVKRKLEEIFNYRFKRVEEIFNGKS
jgi:ligand-binding SRPBCC domain-containing protein